MQVQPLVLSVFTPLSLWLALSTISLASHCSVATLELRLAFRCLSVNEGIHWSVF